MTEAQYARLAPQFASYLHGFREQFAYEPAFGHFQNYSRGLLSDEDRKTVEPLALRSGTAVRTLQAFLATGAVDDAGLRTTLRQQFVLEFRREPDPLKLGTIGIPDETSCLKKGKLTPGVQRQYLGCVGKVDNGIVTVHLAACRGDLKALLDVDLFLPKSWDADRKRCEQAGIPSEKHHESKWKLVFHQWLRAKTDGFEFDWLTFDAGYGSKPAFLHIMNICRQHYVAEIPVNYRVAYREGGRRKEAREMLLSTARKGWKKFVIRHETGGVSVWKYRSCQAFAAKHQQQLIVAVNVATKEVKYFVSNVCDRSVRTLLRVAFRRWPVEHLFRIAKQEVGLMHFEGRSYVGLMRHLTLALVVLGFVSMVASKLRKKTLR